MCRTARSKFCPRHSGLGSRPFVRLGRDAAVDCAELPGYGLVQLPHSHFDGGRPEVVRETNHARRRILGLVAPSILLDPTASGMLMTYFEHRCGRPEYI